MLPENKRRRSLVKTRMNTPFSIERNERKVAQLLECTVHPGEFDKHKCNLNDLYVRKANPRNTQRAQAVVGPSIAWIQEDRIEEISFDAILNIRWPGHKAILWETRTFV